MLDPSPIYDHHTWWQVWAWGGVQSQILTPKPYKMHFLLHFYANFQDKSGGLFGGSSGGSQVQPSPLCHVWWSFIREVLLLRARASIADADRQDCRSLEAVERGFRRYAGVTDKWYEVTSALVKPDVAASYCEESGADLATFRTRFEQSHVPHKLVSSGARLDAIADFDAFSTPCSAILFQKCGIRILAIFPHFLENVIKYS